MKPGRQLPIHCYRERQLETEVICTSCTLRYSVYGVFAFCPDCGQHNSIQILGKNLEVVKKMLNLANRVETSLVENLIKSALENCVSAFDGFGREISRMHANKAHSPTQVEKLSFQNPKGMRERCLKLFRVDLAAGVTAEEWNAVTRAFQKRHLVAHKMGVVDEQYIANTHDSDAVVGRKVCISKDEVMNLAQIIAKMAWSLSNDLQKLGEG